MFIINTADEGTVIVSDNVTLTDVVPAHDFVLPVVAAINHTAYGVVVIHHSHPYMGDNIIVRQADGGEWLWNVSGEYKTLTLTQKSRNDFVGICRSDFDGVSVVNYHHPVTGKVAETFSGGYTFGEGCDDWMDYVVIGEPHLHERGGKVTIYHNGEAKEYTGPEGFGKVVKFNGYNSMKEKFHVAYAASGGKIHNLTTNEVVRQYDYNVVDFIPHHGVVLDIGEGKYKAISWGGEYECVFPKTHSMKVYRTNGTVGISVTHLV